ncbi:MAG: HIT domain-containing protein [Gammaproteobacteria bacterium]
MPFELHPRLVQDCFAIGRLELCRLLLMNDSQYPWFILVPEKTAVEELYQLNAEERQQLVDESCYLAENLAALYRADKMNVAAIGNIVTQLHVHHVVRFRHDKAWPQPIWGKFPAVPYSPEHLADTVQCLKNRLLRCQFESGRFGDQAQQ